VSNDERQLCSQPIAFKDLRAGQLFELKGIAFIKLSSPGPSLHFNAIRTDTGSLWHIGATVAVDPVSINI